MATTLIGIRNIVDATVFLSTDFQNYGGMNNMSFYSKANFPGGYASVNAQLDVSNWQVNGVYFDVYDDTSTGQSGGGSPNTNRAIYSIASANLTSQSITPAPGSIFTNGFVAVITSDTGLNEYQNRPFIRDRVNQTPGLLMDTPVWPTIRNMSVANMNIATGSMIMLDSKWRRALWAGGAGNSNNGNSPAWESALRYVGLTRNNGSSTEFNGNRAVPGTKLQQLYTEPQFLPSF